MGRSRLPKATEEEVVRALDRINPQPGERNTANIKLRSAMTIAGLVAQERGGPGGWPDRDTIAQYVSLSSVKAVLEHLVAEGKAYAVPGDHWAVVGRVSGRYTYYLNECGKEAAIEARELAEARKRAAEREKWTNHKLRERFAMVLDELNGEWEADNPPEDWRAKW